jgi:hypothetical protein
MRITLTLALLLSGTTALAATPTIVPDANAPKGKLPDTVTPTAYRIDFTILPESERFSDRKSRKCRPVFSNSAGLSNGSATAESSSRRSWRRSTPP